MRVVTVVAVALVVACAASIPTLVNAASEGLASAAQDVADAACPFAMMHGYGCPIKQSQEVLAARARRLNRTRLLAGCGGALGDACATAVDEEEDPRLAELLNSQEQHWQIGSVPVGVGFDTTTMSVKLPLFYPTGTATHVYDMELDSKTYTTIDDYMGSMDPTATKALMTGQLNTDMGTVYGTYFGSYSSLHRTTQVDVITKADLTSSPTLLPRVAYAINYLPTTYDETMYNEFISYWGTHVVTAAAIGGACEMLLSVKSCFASGDAALLANAAQEELGVKTMQKHLPNGQKINQAFSEHTSKQSVKMYGGDITLVKPEQWPARQKSIAESPVLIKVNEMVPIANYITDATRKANFERAVTAYQNAAKAKQEESVKQAQAAQSFDVKAATEVEFHGARATFGHRKKNCHRCWIFMHCCHCDGETACFEPGNCGTGCGSGVSDTIVVTDVPTKTLHRGESHTFSPDGSKSCACSHYGGYDTPQWPLNKLDQTFECKMNADGQVVASNVQPQGVDANRRSGHVSHADGKPVAQGCSVATATYTDLSWSESGGDEGCGTAHGTMALSGTVTAKGMCCIGTTLAVEWSKGHEGCYGKFGTASCPSF
eukprot:CAMPEP_0174838254 /NCGR_PEP_ID=MMETSP1114-20130205/7274_1 /TAXON_ID=312471 /ORGANISM="Neobodo designis, Strain CCAP 1951/1" /LENGTH=602 /DNA_ID=CAMNT_0016072349 /DNA_START=46 /DNA_END=1854 /DNA_ORIENTATION=+